MILAPLGLVPSVLRGLLAAWALWDLLPVAEARAFTELVVVLVASVVAEALGSALQVPYLHLAALAGIGGVYVSAHLFILGIPVEQAFGFVTLLLVVVTLRQVLRRFDAVLALPLLPETRARVHGALARSLLRVTVAAAVAYLVAVLAADLSGAGTVPTTSIPTALFLAIGFLVVVLLLALLPFMERRTA